MSAVAAAFSTEIRPRGKAALGHVPGSLGYRRVMLAMFAAGMATFVLLYATQALLPEFVSTFAVSPAEATLTMSLTTAGLAVALLVAGPASEIVGRVNLIKASTWAATAVAFACAFAPTWGLLLALRLLEGVALAGLPAVATAYLREELDPAAQGRAAGLYIGGTALGGMAGRLLTAPVADALGWRWALGAAGLFALVCALVVALILPPSRNFRRSPVGATAIAKLAHGALSDRALLSLYALGACSVGALVAVFNALGFRLTDAPFGLSLGVVSLLYLVYPLGTVSSSISGRLADRLGRRAILPLGCAIAVAGVLFTTVGWLPAIMLGLAGLTVGFFVIHGLASGWVTARAHASGASTSQSAAFYLFAYYVGSSTFGNVGSTLWTHTGWTGVAVLACALLLGSCVFAVLLRRIPPLR